MPDDFEDRINVEFDVESYQKQPDGTIILICMDGTRIRLLPDGSSELIEGPHNE